MQPLAAVLKKISSVAASGMKAWVKIQPNPIRFLFYTEWLILIICILTVVLVREQGNAIQHLLILTLLGVMGLILPRGELLGKVLYTASEIALIFYGSNIGNLPLLPTLYLIVVIRSCFLFALPGQIGIASLAFLLFLVHQIGYWQINPLPLPAAPQQLVWMHQLTEIVLFALVLCFGLQLVNTLLGERQRQTELCYARAQLQSYATQVEDFVAVKERNSIAHNIHDSLSHTLTSLNIQLQTTAKLWSIDAGAALEFLKQAQRLGEIAIEEMRRSVKVLHVDAIDLQPPEEVIQSLVRDFRQSTGVSTSTNIILSDALPPQIVKFLYRIVQKTLTNISKYAQATQVQIYLVVTNETVCLSVEDNGRGFSLTEKNMKFELQGMQPQIAALNGRFDIRTELGNGCLITVELPLN